MMQSKIIGLTGGISTGKSTVSNILIKKGYRVIDADKIAKNISNFGTKTYFKIVDYFGDEILLSDREIDRKKLGTIIFNDEEKRQALNGITHGDIMEEMKKQLDVALTKEKIVILDIPLLIESLDEFKSFGVEFDEIILVTIDRKLQIERLMTRDCIDEDLAIKKIDAQMPIEDKKEYASVIIENDGNLEDLKLKVDDLIEDLF